VFKVKVSSFSPQKSVESVGNVRVDDSKSLKEYSIRLLVEKPAKITKFSTVLGPSEIVVVIHGSVTSMT
jgi:ribonuclease HIII